MILLSILLTAGLDLSLPEFEPDDVSGNYIVSEYDISGDEFISVELPAVELSGPGVFRATADGFLETSILEGYGFKNNNDVFTIVSDATKNIRYVTCESGYTYTFGTDAPRVWLASSLAVGTVLTEIQSPYICDSTSYLCVLDTRYLNVISSPTGGGGDSGDVNLDLTPVVDAIDDMHDQLYMQSRIIVLILLFNFCYPLILSSFKNFFGGNKNV